MREMQLAIAEADKRAAVLCDMSPGRKRDITEPFFRREI